MNNHQVNIKKTGQFVIVGSGLTNWKDGIYRV